MPSRSPRPSGNYRRPANQRGGRDRSRSPPPIHRNGNYRDRSPFPDRYMGNYTEFRVYQLKVKLRERGLHVTGVKVDLIKRLREDDEKRARAEIDLADEGEDGIQDGIYDDDQEDVEENFEEDFQGEIRENIEDFEEDFHGEIREDIEYLVGHENGDIDRDEIGGEFDLTGDERDDERDDMDGQLFPGAPLILYDATHEDCVDKVCCICLEEFGEEENDCKIPVRYGTRECTCKTVVGFNCLNSWFDGSNRCLICRKLVCGG